MLATKQSGGKRAVASGKKSRAMSTWSKADEARFDAWIKDFDARMADLSVRQDALMRKLRIEPTRQPNFGIVTEAMAIPAWTVFGGWFAAWMISSKIDRITNSLDILTDDVRALEKRLVLMEAREELLTEKARAAAAVAASGAVTAHLVDMSRRIGILEASHGGPKRIADS